MTNLKFLFLCLIFSTCSCSINLKSAVNKQCNFDSENLKVYFSDSKDTIFHIRNVGYALAFQYLDFGNINCLKPKYIDVPSKEIWLKTFTISNIGCKDTIWSKDKIKEELQRRCPFAYSFSDTFCIRKHYQIKLIDSNLLIKSNQFHEDISGYFSGGVSDWTLIRGVEFKDIGNEIVPRSCASIDESCGCCRNSGVIMLDSLPGRFDIRIFHKFNEILGEEVHIKMVRDSLGFDIKWVKDELVPYKIITYTKKKG